MKKKLLLLPLLSGLIYIVGSSYSSGPASTGSIDGCGATTTGGCSGGGSCHTANTSTTVTMELDTVGGAAVTNYVPGGSYTIKITGVNTSTAALPRFGFQLSSVKSTGAGTSSAVYAGTLATSGLPASTHNVTIGSGTIHYVEHTSATAATTLVGGGTSGTTYVRSINWTAPAAGTGSVKFCGVVNAVNFDGGTSGDRFNTGSLTVPEHVAAITGTTTVCVGSDVTLSDATTGGTWSSSNTAVATITTGGVVHGVSAGTTTISYNAGTAGIATATVTVSGPPSAGTITSTATAVCTGSIITLSNTAAPGGVWSTSTPGIATINSSGGLTGVTAGNANITYTVTGTCGSSFTTTVIPVEAPAGSIAISGPTFVCGGSSISLTHTGPSGGVWSSSATTIASVNSSTGVVTGIGGGVTTISYAYTNSCGIAQAVYTDTVGSAPDVDFITGNTIICTGSSNVFHDAVAGGTWSFGTAGIATVSSAASDSATISGVSAGITILSYTASNSCGTASTTRSITVNDPIIAGVISGPLTPCPGATVTYTYTGSAGSGSITAWHTTNSSAVSINSAIGTAMTGTAGSSGSTVISMNISNGCSHDSVTLSVSPLPATDAGSISGPGTVCTGSTISLIDGVGSGTWSSSNTAVATVNSLGVVTGVTSGTVTISYTVSGICGAASAIHTVTVNTVPNAGTIFGSSTICQGTTTTLTPTVSGGSWSSGATGVATVNASGVVTGVTAGNATITYTVSNTCGSATATQAMTVNPLPSAGTLSGLGSVCVGAATTLTPSVSGGTWSSSASAVATVSGTGVVSGVTTGTAVITYTVTNSCGTATTTHFMTVNPAASAGTISGSAFICIGTSSTLTSTVPGGSWASSNPAIVSINSSGVATGVATGTATITYSVTGTCGTATALYTVSSGLSASAGTITGLSSVCTGANITLVDLAGSGTWSSSAPGVAVVNPTTGVVTGISGGTATISYVVSSSCGTATATTTVTVIPVPLPGVISGATAVCAGSAVSMAESVPGGTWSSNNTGVATIDASGNVTGVNSGTVIIIYTVANACGSVTALHTMIVNPVPAVTTISGANILCQGNAAVLTAGITGGVWSATNGTATVSSSGVVTGVGAGIDTINYTITNVCGTATTTFVDTILPTAVSGHIAGNTYACLGDTSYYSVVALGGTWHLSNGNATFDVTTGTFVPVTAGYDTLNYSFSNVCGTYSDTVVIHILTATECAALGVAQTPLLQGISVYPNPSEGRFTVELPQAVMDARILITDLTGKVVESRAVTGTATFNLAGLASGSYIIKVNAGEQVYVTKVLVR